MSMPRRVEYRDRLQAVDASWSLSLNVGSIGALTSLVMCPMSAADDLFDVSRLREIQNVSLFHYMDAQEAFQVV